MGRIINTSTPATALPTPALPTPAPSAGLGRLGKTSSSTSTTAIPSSIQSKHDEIQAERLARYNAGEPVSVNKNKAVPSFFGNIIRGPLQLISAGLESVRKPIASAIDVAEGKDPEKEGNAPYQPFKNAYLGDIYPIGYGKNEGKEGSFLHAAGQGLEAASYDVGGEGAVSAGKDIVQSAFKQAIKTGAKEGLTSGFLAGLGTGLENPDRTPGSVAKSTAIGTGAGGLLGIGTAGVFGMAGKGFQAARDFISGKLAKVTDPAVVTDTLVHAGVDPKVAESVTPDVVKSSDPAEITKVINKEAENHAAFGQSEPYLTSQDGSQVSKRSIFVGGKIGGSAIIDESKDGYQPVLMDLFLENQRRGFGTDLYKKLNKESLERTGNPLRTQDQYLSEASKATWEKFVRNNLAEKTDDGYRMLPPASDTLKDFDPDKYVAEQTAKQDAAKAAGEPSFGTKASRFAANAKAKLVDFTAPIEDLLYDSVRKNDITLKPSEDIHNQIDRVLRSPTIAGQFAKDNGLADIIKNVDDPKKLEQYLIAKQGIDLNAKGIETGRDVVKDKALVAAYGPQYEPYAQAFSNYSQKLLDYISDSGLISKDLADNLKKEYPNYVPFNRIFSDEEMRTGVPQRPAAGGVSSLSGQNIVQKIKGSTREVDSPIESILAKTNDAFKQGEKNKAGQLLASYKDLPENPFQLRELQDGEKPKAGMSTISYLEDGQKKTFETTPEVAQAAKALNVQQLNILGKIFAAPVRVAKLGITGINLPFVGANVAKDQVSAFINSDHSLATSVANPVNFVKSLFAALSHNDLYEELVREAGGGTSFDIARNQAENTIERIRSGRSVGAKIKYLAKNPSELLRSVEDIIGRSEELTRIQQYAGTKKSLIDSGMSEAEAKIAAARAARENTVNFSRRGEWGTVLNSAFLYLNAGIQGTRTLLRNLSNKPAETVSKIAIGAFFPVAAATAWNLSDPARKAAYKDIPDYEKQNNIIIVPENPTKDANGKWNVIKIPLSQEIANLVGLVRRPLESAEGLDPLKFGDIATSLLGTVLPFQPNLNGAISTLVPQAIKPSVEEATNKNLFTGNQIVPDNMKNLSPENQVRTNTSASARKIGKLLGVSPIKVQSFIQETFGGVGTQAEHYVDVALAASGAAPKEEIGGQGILDAITARFSKAAGGQTEQDIADEVTSKLTKQADNAYVANKNAEAKYAEIQAMPKDKAKAELLTLAKTNPLLAKNVVKIADEDAKGLTYSDRLVNLLQVKNGERAKYIVNKLDALSTPQEKRQLLQDYVHKQIITASVMAQIAVLLKKEKKQ